MTKRPTPSQPTVSVPRGIRWHADLYPRLVKATKGGNFSALVNALVREALDSRSKKAA